MFNYNTENLFPSAAADKGGRGISCKTKNQEPGAKNKEQILFYNYGY
jgi:hypothetical protein